MNLTEDFIAKGVAWAAQFRASGKDDRQALCEAVDQGILFLGDTTYNSPLGDAFIVGIGRAFGYTKVR